MGTPPSAQEILEGVLRGLAAQVLVVSLLFASYAASRRLLPSASLALRWLATAVLGLWLATLGFHALFWLGGFALAPALALALLAGLAASPGAGGPRRLLRALGADAARAFGAAASLRAGPVPVFAVGAALALMIAAHAVLVPIVSWDSLTYHAAKAALWVQGGGPAALEAPGGWSMYRHYLAGGEVFTAWAMLPFHSDLLVGAVDAVQWLLVGLAVYALGEQLRLERASRWCAAAYAMSLPAVARAVGSAYVDNALALALLAALALALYAVRERCLRAACVGLLGLGLAAGIKVFAFPVAAALVPALFALLLPEAARRPGAAWFAAGLAGAAAVAAPWLVVNWWETGYPLSPLPASFAGLTLGEANDALRWYVDRPAPEGLPWGGELLAFLALFAVPGSVPQTAPTLGLFTLVPVALFPVALVRCARSDARVAALLLVFTAPLVVAYCGPAMKITRVMWAGVSGRYLVAVAAVAVVASFACLPRAGAARGLYRTALLAAALVHFALSTVADWTRAELVLSGSTALAALAALGWGRRAGPVALSAAALFATLLLSGYRDASRADALGTATALHASPRYWVAAANRLEAAGRPATVAVTSGPYQDADNWLLYPFLGSRFQNRLVYVSVTGDGTVVDPSRYEERRARARVDRWLARLQQHGVTHVMSFQPQSLELSWMEQRPALFTRLAGDGRRWGLYGFRAAGEP